MENDTTRLGRLCKVNTGKGSREMSILETNIWE